MQSSVKAEEGIRSRQKDVSETGWKINIFGSHTTRHCSLVSVISQFMHELRQFHLQGAYRILHYLKGSPGNGVLFKRNGRLTLEV